MELPISPTTGLPEAEHGDWADVLSQQLNQYTSLCCRPCRLRSLESAFFFFPFSHRHSQFRSVFPPYVSIFFVDAVGYQWNGAGTTFTFTCRGTLCCTGHFFFSLCYEAGTMLYKLYSLLHFVKYICGLRWTYTWCYAGHSRSCT